ncbi:hypothetical protein KXX06_003678, partial [Aspergillus fumigatus]
MTPVLKDHNSLETTYISHLQRKVKILLDNAGLRLSTQAYKAFMIRMQRPNIIRMLMSASKRAIKTKILS